MSTISVDQDCLRLVLDTSRNEYQTQYIWVGEGCSGAFADAARPTTGSHRAGSNEMGAIVAGTILGAVLEGMAEDDHHHGKHAHSSGYDGCHGVGCDVDDPDD